MSERSWKKGAPAGMGYGFAFNDHLQALTAAAKAKLRADQPAEEQPAESPRQETEAPRRG